MSKTKDLLIHALLHNGPMEQALYDFELHDLLSDLITSLKEDNDEYIFAITHNNGDVAMVFVESPNNVYINEVARGKLMEAWEAAYPSNIQMLIPNIAKELDAGGIMFNGVKTASYEKRLMHIPKKRRF